MDGETAPRVVLPRFTRSTKKREQGTLQKWVQCTRCRKWRRVPFNLKDADLGDSWECKDNVWDSAFSACSIPQAMSDEQIDAILKDDEEELEMGVGGFGGESFDHESPCCEDGDEHIYPSRGEAPATFTRRVRTPPHSTVRTSSRLRARVATICEPEPQSTTSSRGGRNAGRGREGRGVNGRSRGAARGAGNRNRGDKRGRGRRVGSGEIDIAEALLGMGAEDGSYHSPQMHLDVEAMDFEVVGEGSSRYPKSAFLPGKIVWGKVEGHDWWPAKVVRRRSVPSEVGPPPGGVAGVMSYTPVVFFTEGGIPREVELGMDNVEFPIILCQRACGKIEEEEAEFAWLSPDSIRPFLSGDAGVRNLSNNETLQRCINAAQKALTQCEMQGRAWHTDEEDSDGGWGSSAGILASNSNKSRNAKRKSGKGRGYQKRRARHEEDGSDIESGVAEGGPELLSYGTWELQPRIAVEHIYAWRKPLAQEERSKERRAQKKANKRKLRQLDVWRNSLGEGHSISECIARLADVPEASTDNSEDDEASQKSDPEASRIRELDREELRDIEKEAVSTLLGFTESTSYNRVPQILDFDAVRTEPEYYVKYANRSHMHNEWVNETTLAKIAKRKLINFKRRYGSRPVNMFEPKWADPERLVGRRKCKTGPGWELLVKWKDLGYEQCTWEAENLRILNQPEAVGLYLAMWERQREALERNSPQATEKAHAIREYAQKNPTKIDSQPSYIQGSKLHKHQLESLQWLRSQWLKSKNAVLLGEPGLGKTACVTAFALCLRREFMCVGPILVVAPHSRLEQWGGEVAFWSGNTLDCVTFQGPNAAKNVIWDNEVWQATECFDGKFPWEDARRIPRGDVVLTSYESLSPDFGEIPWSLTVLDSRGGSKGSVSRMANALSGFEDSMHMVVATQLPKSQPTLTGLLKYVDPHAVSALEDSGSNDEEDGDTVLAQLESHIHHSCLTLPAPSKPVPLISCKEVVLPVGIPPEQSECYKATLAKYYEVLTDQNIPRHSSHSVNSLRRIVQEMWLVCHHPFLLEDGGEWTLEGMLKVSGKLRVVDKLLKGFLEKGSKIVLVTQTPKTLELLAEYMEKRFGNHMFESVTSGDSASAQFKAVQKFSSPSYSGFVFLAMPECFGLGTYLPTVTSVVIFDSPPDPTADLHALARAYQIGATTKVPVVRLMLAGSVEEKILKLADRRSGGLESILGQGHTRGTAADARLLEDILVTGCQLHIFQKQEWNPKSEEVENGDVNENENKETGKSPAMGHKDGVKSGTDYVEASSETVGQLVDFVVSGRSMNTVQKMGTLEGALKNVTWRIRDVGGGMDIDDQDADATSEVENELVTGGAGCALFWEGLLKETWEDLKRKEEQELERERREAEAEEDAMYISEHEGESAGVQNENEQAAPVVVTRTARTRGKGGRNLGRRKRGDEYAEPEAEDTPPGKKKRRAPRAVMDCQEWDHQSNGTQKWTRDFLLSSKSQQDDLMRSIADPATMEGQAAQRAFSRIDQIGQDLNLPPSMIMMAKQIAEVLLSLREETNQGAYFQDYTLVVLVAFSAHLGGIDLGENFGLPMLARKYDHGLPEMEQVMSYITNTMKEYKMMMLKIKQLDGEKEQGQGVETSTAMTPPGATASAPQFGGPGSQVPSTAGALQALSNHPGAFLHTELDIFLRRLSEIIASDQKPDVDMSADALNEPSGVPMKGHVGSFPPQASPTLSTEMSDIVQQARACDAEMYAIEKGHETKVRAIEKLFQDFQEKVRSYGLKALEEVHQATVGSKQTVEQRQQTLRQSLSSLSSLPIQTTALQQLLALQVNQQRKQQSQQTLQRQQEHLRALGCSRTNAMTNQVNAGSSSLPSSAPVVFPPRQMGQMMQGSGVADVGVMQGSASNTVQTRPAQSDHQTGGAQVPHNQQVYEGLQVVHKSGNGHPVVLQPSSQQHLRAFAPAGSSTNQAQQSVGPIERFLVTMVSNGLGSLQLSTNQTSAPLEKPNVQSQHTDYGSRVVQYALSNQQGAGGHVLQTTKGMSNQQILLQQFPLQRMIQEGGNIGGIQRPLPTMHQRQPQQPSTPFAGVHQQTVAAALSKPPQVPASLGPALSTLLPPYANVRVVHNHAPRSGATPNAVPSSKPLGGESGPANHRHAVVSANPMEGVSFVRGTARVIHEPPAYRLEPAKAARVVFPQGMPGSLSGSGRAAAVSTAGEPQSSGHRTADGGGQNMEVRASSLGSLSKVVPSTISTGGNLDRPPSPPTLQTINSGGPTTITTGTLPGGPVASSQKQGNGVGGPAGPITGSQDVLMPSVPSGNAASERSLGLVTTGDDGQLLEVPSVSQPKPSTSGAAASAPPSLQGFSSSAASGPPLPASIPGLSSLETTANEPTSNGGEPRSFMPSSQEPDKARGPTEQSGRLDPGISVPTIRPGSAGSFRGLLASAREAEKEGLTQQYAATFASNPAVRALSHVFASVSAADIRPGLAAAAAAAAHDGNGHRETVSAPPQSGAISEGKKNQLEDILTSLAGRRDANQ